MGIMAGLATGAARRLSEDLREERTMRRDSRRAQGFERYKSGLRMSEQSVLQHLRENSPQYKAQLEQSQAATGAAQAGTARTEQQIANEPAVQARLGQQVDAEVQRAETGAVNAGYRGDEIQERRDRRAEEEEARAKPKEDREMEWVTFKDGNPGASPDELYALAGRLRVSTSDSPGYKDWVNIIYKPWKKAMASGGDQDPEAYWTPPAPPTPPRRPTSSVTAPTDVSPIPGADRMGAPEQDPIRGQVSAAASPRAAMGAPAPTPGDAAAKAGMAPYDIAEIDRLAQIWGVDFTTAKTRADLMMAIGQ